MTTETITTCIKCHMQYFKSNYIKMIWGHLCHLCLSTVSIAFVYLSICMSVCLSVHPPCLYSSIPWDVFHVVQCPGGNTDLPRRHQNVTVQKQMSSSCLSLVQAIATLFYTKCTEACTISLVDMQANSKFCSLWQASQHVNEYVNNFKD